MDANRRCLCCERERGWVSRQKYEYFCSSECSSKYREQMNTLAVERLNAARLDDEQALADGGRGSAAR